MVRYGVHSADEPIDLKGLALVGEGAYAQRQSEIGERGSTFGKHRADPETGVSLDADHLRQLVEHAKELLGSEFERLAISDRLSRTSRTPPVVRHGLIRAISLLEAAEQSFARPNPFVDVRAWSELRVLVTLVDRWRGHPEFDALRKGLVHEYEHTVILLATATWLEDWGNGVSLQEARPGQRSPDLRLGSSPRQEAYVEIKAPRSLNWPAESVTRQMAAHIVRKAVNKAGTGKQGQLKQGLPSLLVIGGFQLSEPDLNLLERAADVYLASAARQQIHKSLMGIILVGVGRQVQKRFSAIGEVVTTAGRRVDFRISRNPGYKGDAELKITTLQGFGE